MDISSLKKILSRLFSSYVKRHFSKLMLALVLSFGVAGGTAAIAWLLDPAVKKIFIEQDKTMLLIIPFAIVFAFTIKGLSLYFARTILIKIANEVVRNIQVELSECFLKSDISTIESKHSGKYIQHFLYDVGLVSQLVGNGILNLMKDSLTLLVLIALMFYQNWKLAIFALIMMPLAAIVAKSLGKRLGKVTSESAKVIGNLTAFLSEMIKGSRMIKIYQQENFEFNRAKKVLHEHMSKQNKIGFVMIRAQPIMEMLTGFMIAGFIFYTGLMVSTGEIEINNFFSFLTAMMLAYQPIRSLATINMLFYQGAAGAERVFNILDTESHIKENKAANNQVFNVGFGKPISVLDVAKILHQLYASRGEIIMTNKYRIGDIRHNYADLKKITSLINYRPTIDFLTGVEEFVSWVKSQDLKIDHYNQTQIELFNKGLIR